MNKAAANERTHELRIAPLTSKLACELCDWHYEPPYDLYEWSSWEDMVESGIEFGDPVLRKQQYAAVLNELEELVGFAQFFPMLGVTRLGLGIRPDLCGQGMGSALVRLLAEEAIRRAPGDEIDLEVLSWNVRAIRAYEKAGFLITDTYSRRTPQGPSEFHCMIYQPSMMQPTHYLASE
ncbi:GNAT family N-acetyltransferase [Paenibacillus sp. GCM10023252]|uniref:GNAT family N-acetyltransferase n=1 Tax=Paenibacillus sp. GCM10023252 TaxID=3252649 RepID=UPI00361D412B